MSTCFTSEITIKFFLVSICKSFISSSWMWSLLLVFNGWHYLCFFEHLSLLFPLFSACYYIWRHLHWRFNFVSWLMAYFFCDFAFFFRFFAVSCLSLTLFPFLLYNLVIFILSFLILSAETHFTWRTLCSCLPVLLGHHKSSQQANGYFLLA